VKQQSVSVQYIVINDNMEMLARDFISEGEGREQDNWEAERERECVLEAEHWGEREMVLAIK